MAACRSVPNLARYILTNYWVFVFENIHSVAQKNVIKRGWVNGKVSIVYLVTALIYLQKLGGVLV